MLKKIKDKVEVKQMKLISFTSVLLVFLLGAVVVMGSLIFQFANGGVFSDNNDSYPAGTPVVVSDSIPPTGGTTQNVYVDVYREVIPSTVVIENDGKFYVGLIVSSDGVAVVPYLAASGHETKTAILPNNERISFEVIAYDIDLLYASIQLDDVNLRPSNLSTVTNTNPGDDVYAFGCNTNEYMLISKGIISKTDLENNLLYTDAPIVRDFGNTILANTMGQIIAISDGTQLARMSEVKSIVEVLTALDIPVGFQSSN